MTGNASAMSRALSRVAAAGLILACLAAPLFLLPSARTTLPVDLILGRESPEAYVQRAVPSGSVLLDSSRMLPPETPVAYIGGDWEGPQIYTESRLLYPIAEHLGATADAVLASLDLIGVRYVIWNRTDSHERDWRSTLLSSDFLERHTRILAGDRDAYLFEVLPESELRWGTKAPGNLLADPQFATLRKGTGPWIISGKVAVADGTLMLRRRSAISQQVSVSPGEPYLLIASGRCGDDVDRVELSLRWLDADGEEIGAAVERVLPGTDRGEQFLWRRAPEDAAAVVAGVAVTGSASCAFDAITLHEAP